MRGISALKDTDLGLIVGEGGPSSTLGMRGELLVLELDVVLGEDRESVLGDEDVGKLGVDGDGLSLYVVVVVVLVFVGIVIQIEEPGVSVLLLSLMMLVVSLMMLPMSTVNERRRSWSATTSAKTTRT